VLDELLDAVASIPRGQTVDEIKLYDNILKELGVSNLSNVRGIYGEGALYKRLTGSNEKLTETRPDLVVDVTTLKIGDNVDTARARNVQGPDSEASLVAKDGSGRPIYIEAKNRTSSVGQNARAEFVKQSDKHMKTNVRSKIQKDSAGNWVWADGVKPHMHYEYMGSAFVKADGSGPKAAYEKLKQAIIDKFKKHPLFSVVQPALIVTTI